jgi:hypothetical protein
VAERDYEVIEQQMNAIQLGILASPESNLTEAQKTRIRLAAAQCPVSGGRGVYRARALQQLFEHVDYNNRDACSSQATNKVLRAIPTVKTNFIAPNPNGGNFLIALEEPSLSGTEISITNISGQIVFKQQLTEDQSKFSFSLPQLGAGFYICNITNSGRVLYAQKLVINK